MKVYDIEVIRIETKETATNRVMDPGPRIVERVGDDTTGFCEDIVA